MTDSETPRPTDAPTAAPTPGPTSRTNPRLLTADATTEALTTPLPADEEVLDGSPTAAVTELSAEGDVGIWEMTAGTVRDTEVEEVFVVVAGSGSVAFEDGEVITLGPGTVVSLAAGERTTWTVERYLRKVYWAR